MKITRDHACTWTARHGTVRKVYNCHYAIHDDVVICLWSIRRRRTRRTSAGNKRGFALLLLLIIMFTSRRDCRSLARAEPRWEGKERRPAPLRRVTVEPFTVTSVTAYCNIITWKRKVTTVTLDKTVSITSSVHCDSLVYNSQKRFCTAPPSRSNRSDKYGCKSR